MTDWKYSPQMGAEFVEPRRAEIVQKAQEAANILFYLIEEKEKAELEEVRKRFNGHRKTVTTKVEQIERAPAMDIVRKYWNFSPDQFVTSIVSGFAGKIEGAGND